MNYFEQMEALAEAQGGYFYPWRSSVDGEDGEGAYTRLVEQYLTPGAVVLETGCGHGTDLLAFAPKVARYIAYDAVEPFVRVARERAAAAGLTNVELVVANSSAQANGGVVRMPAPDRSVDLIVSRRGPTNWIADAPRVCRPGARLIQINPLPTPTPDWNEALPPALRLSGGNPAAPLDDSLPDQIAGALAKACLALDRSWTFDVAEAFDNADELYRYLTFLRFEDGLPSRDEARPVLADLIAQHGGALASRKRRFLWTAVVA